jgi:hypothetical protein
MPPLRPIGIDRLLVNIQSDGIHMISWNTYDLDEPPWLFSESASPLSSAFCNTSCSSLTYVQTIRQCGSVSC